MLVGVSAVCANVQGLLGGNSRLYPALEGDPIEHQTHVLFAFQECLTRNSSSMKQLQRYIETLKITGTHG